MTTSKTKVKDFHLKPLADRVIVSPILEETTKSGIIIPDTNSKERPERGVVVAVGEGKIGDDHKRIALEVSVGDVVIFSKYGPDEIKIEGLEYYILREDQILAIVK
jgi:chaperonin GroES